MKKLQGIPDRLDAGRRKALVQTASLGAAAIAAPHLLTSAHAQADDLAPYQSGEDQLAPGRG